MMATMESTNCKDCKFGTVLKTGPNNGTYTKCSKSNEQRSVFVSGGVVVCNNFVAKEIKK